MNKIVLLGWTEFKRLFNSPLAWVFLAVLQFALALMFLLLLDTFITDVQTQTVGQEVSLGVTDVVVSRIFLWAGVIMSFMLPVITMRSFAEERANKTLTLLTSSPMTMTQLVLGKYAALLLLILTVVIMVTSMSLSLILGTELDIGRIMTSAIGLFFLLASLAAAGVYISSLTSHPMIAAIGSFGLLLILVVIYMSGTSSTNASELFIYLSHISHYFSFTDGILNSVDVVYYVLFIVLFIVLTIRHLDKQRLLG